MCKPSGPKQKTTPDSKSPTCACGPYPTPSMTAKANAHDEQKCDNLCPSVKFDMWRSKVNYFIIYIKYKLVKSPRRIGTALKLVTGDLFVGY